MKSRIAYLCLGITGTIWTQNSPQSLPDAPHAIHRTWVDYGLTGIDTGLRIADTRTSYVLFNNPCRCFHESDPIAPKGRGIKQIAGFQIAAGLAVNAGAEFLRRKNHPKWARALLVADIVSESIAVGRNASFIPAPSPAPLAAPINAVLPRKVYR